MPKYTFRASNLETYQEIEELEKLDPIDGLKDVVTPPYEVEGYNKNQALDKFCKHFDSGENAHPVFINKNKFYYYIKDGDSYTRTDYNEA